MFMNTKNSRTNEPNRFRLHFTDKLNLKNNKTIALANLSIYYTWQNVKSAYKNNKFKITAQPGMRLLIYLMVVILFPIFQITLNLLLKNTKLLQQMKFLQC